jgi:hypothetical protein
MKVALSASASGIRDAAGNQSSFAATTVADKAPPVPVGVVLANGGTLGRADSGDKVTITYSEVLDATTMCSTWTNSGTQTLSGNNAAGVTFTINEAASNDTLSITSNGNASCGGTTNFKLGTLSLGGDYVAANTPFAGNGSGQSVIQWDPVAKTLVLTLGSGTGSKTSVPAGIPTYTPSASVTDRASPANSMAATGFSGTSSRY